MIPNVLAIAGSDPSGGAGIQADLKSISAAGGYGMSVITALTAQNTQGVQAVHIPPTDFLRTQLESISTDIKISTIKIGMLANAEVITTIREWLDAHPELSRTPVVLDPVMISTSGARLLDEEAIEALRELLPYATVITPNLPELAVITGAPSVTTIDAGVELAKNWQNCLMESRSTHGIRPPAVLVKGGHSRGERADNMLVRADGTSYLVTCTRVNTPNTHGTGCSLSSAIATKLASGDIDHAVSWSTAWLHGAIVASSQLDVGHGHGPVHHFYRY